MPPAKRSPSASSSPSSSSGSAAKRTRAASPRAKSGATTTAGTAKATGAARTTRAARATGAAAAAAAAAAKDSKTSVKAASTRARRAGADNAVSVAEQLAKGAIKPRELVLLTRGRIQETLDDAASRGRVTRKDANDLVTELVRRGRSEGHDLVGEVEALLARGRAELGSATKRARGTESVDRIVRGADRARRSVGVGPSFPILGYDQLNAVQIQSRIKELSKPELRKVLTYERKHSNRKSVIGAIEKSLH
jgi:hypothetical protein